LIRGGDAKPGVFLPLRLLLESNLTVKLCDIVPAVVLPKIWLNGGMAMTLEQPKTVPDAQARQAERRMIEFVLGAKILAGAPVLEFLGSSERLDLLKTYADYQRFERRAAPLLEAVERARNAAPATPKPRAAAAPPAPKPPPPPKLQAQPKPPPPPKPRRFLAELSRR
jgi:hypothetical protein